MEIDKMQHLEVIPQKYQLDKTQIWEEQAKLINIKSTQIIRALMKTLIEEKKTEYQNRNHHSNKLN